MTEGLAFQPQDFRELTQVGFQTLVLPIEANSFRRIAGSFTYLKVLAATSANIELEINNGGRWVPPIGTEFLFKQAFKSFQVYDRSGLPNTVTILAGLGDARDPGSIVTGTFNIAKAANISTVADVTLTAGVATSIVAASPTRRSVSITNLSPSTAIRIGDSAITATRGDYLAPLQTKIYETTAQYFGFTPSAGISVSVYSELD